MNIGVHRFLWIGVLRFLEYNPSSEIAESKSSSFFSFFEEIPYCFPQWLHQSAFPPIVQKGSLPCKRFLSILTSTCSLICCVYLLFWPHLKERNKYHHYIISQSILIIHKWEADILSLLFPICLLHIYSILSDLIWSSFVKYLSYLFILALKYPNILPYSPESIHNVCGITLHLIKCNEIWLNMTFD